MNTRNAYRSLLKKLRAARLNVERETHNYVGRHALWAMDRGETVTNRELARWQTEAKEDLIIQALRAQADRIDCACSGLEVRASRANIELS